MATFQSPEAPVRSPFLPHPYRVTSVRRENADTWTLTLQPQASAIATPSPGQFNMLYAFGIGEVPISLSAQGRGDELIHTVRAVGAVSRAICGAKRGTVLGVRGPFGTGWPLDEVNGSDIVIIAGGVGLAPLRPAVHAVLANPRRFGRAALLVGARTPADMIFVRELERWTARPGLDVHATVDSADAAWRGHVGVVTQLIPRAAFRPSQSIALVCGPDVMIRYAVGELERAGLSRDRIYISMERNMKCAIGLCGRCQFGPSFICKDGPVFPYRDVAPLLAVREV
jgi:NAD(P)H-flavin reductase